MSNWTPEQVTPLAGMVCEYGLGAFISWLLFRGVKGFFGF